MPFDPPHRARSLPPAWRWIGIAARSLHLIAVVLVGVALFGAPIAVPFAWVAGLLLGTGALLFALDQWKTRDHALQFAGAGQIAKLALVAWMMADATQALPLFWLIVVWSSVFSHAPATFRHTRVDDLLRSPRAR